MNKLFSQRVLENGLYAAQGRSVKKKIKRGGPIKQGASSIVGLFIYLLPQINGILE